MTSRTLSLKTIVVYVIVAIGILYQVPYMSRYWKPHDDGSVSLAAWRLNEGDTLYKEILPVYNGGLDFFHALVFQVGGYDAGVLRFALFFVAAIALIAVTRSFTTKLYLPEAALTTIAIVYWGPLNYSTAMPSWYNLFLAMIACALIVGDKGIKSRKMWFLCGVLAGFSVLIKLTGLYLIAALAYVLVYQNQSGYTKETGKASLLTKLSITLGLSAVPLAVGIMILGAPDEDVISMLLFFCVPLIAVSGYLIYREINGNSPALLTRWKDLIYQALPVIAGFAIPMLIFIAYLATNGVLGAFYQHQFVDTLGRALGISLRPSLIHTFTVMGAVPVALTFIVTVLPPKILNSKVLIALGGIALFVSFGYILYIANTDRAYYQTAWGAFRTLLPLGIIASITLLYLRKSQLPEDAQRRLFTLAAFTACIALIQFPFAHGIYFLYTAPFGLLLAAEISNASALPNRALTIILLLFLCAFPPIAMHGKNTARLGIESREISLNKLDLERSKNILAYDFDVATYTKLIELIQSHSKPDEPIFVLKDAPEVYFLANREPAFPYTWGIPFAEGEGRQWFEETMEELNELGVKVVVLKLRVEFQPQLPLPLIQDFQKHFPNGAVTPGGVFLVLWR
ncbi:hypothetical protein [Rubellicoccus peritrichatus]|uniref:Glycosyltransferase RgtA/B/C/D-like domain-containing protein n=1 Tax=Rubellicoccus peritrichatus TaxID=3080537 RepID=A0AAQ3LBY7_9BACT|nr:hypothetical protein [Puniceicoccus sp. CR14]WOO42951.1 hypothetical protein RZN69_07585 [Puniceicoccus sp. CR14]